MININRWVGYVSISIVMIFGVLMVSGMVGDFALSTRLAIGGLVLLYVLMRLMHMLYIRRKRSERDSFRA